MKQVPCKISMSHRL